MIMFNVITIIWQCLQRVQTILFTYVCIINNTFSVQSQKGWSHLTQPKIWPREFVGLKLKPSIGIQSHLIHLPVFHQPTKTSLNEQQMERSPLSRKVDRAERHFWLNSVLQEKSAHQRSYVVWLNNVLHF